MPPSIRDWVDPDGLPAFISDLVDDLDLAPFLAAHDEPRGMPPYHPAMMLKVLLYGYATGVRSSRKLEERLKSDVGFMYPRGRGPSGPQGHRRVPPPSSRGLPCPLPRHPACCARRPAS